MSKSVTELLKNISKTIMVHQDKLFSCDRAKQEKFIRKLLEPKNEYDNSFSQYRCQSFLLGLPVSICVNVGAFFLLIFQMRLKEDEVEIKKYDAVFISQGISKNVLPRSLDEEYSSIITVDSYNLQRFDKNDRDFVANIWKSRPFNFHYILKVLLKVKQYSYLINAYSPKAIIVNSEYSFTSSIMTRYCRDRNIEHVNVMHGEKLYYIRDSFFEFDRCYVWDAHYIELFKLLRANRNNYIIELPDSMGFSIDDTIKQYDYTYYLGNESVKEMKKISKILDILRLTGNRVSVRPHPRYSDLKCVQNVFYNFDVEDTKEIAIEHSLKITRNAIALYSTVLNQAIHNGINIIIDDMINPKKFVKLSELNYICLNKKHTLLSDVVQGKVI